MHHFFFLLLSLLLLLLPTTPTQQHPPNTMTFLSSFSLSKQNDLNQTFTQLQLIIPQLNHTERIGKTYRIYEFTPVFTVLDSKQTASISGINTLKVEGAFVKVAYKFRWEKRQLGAAVRGTAEGAVISDRVSFEKQIQIDADTHQPTWKIHSPVPNITFTNSFSVKNVIPYNANDTQILDLMLNKNQGGTQSGRQLITDGINKLYGDLLNQSAKSHSEDIQVNRTIVYTYNSYKGPQTVTYGNEVVATDLRERGLVFTFVQKIRNYSDFDYGQEVPKDPKDPSVYGGHQSYMNLQLLKSTVLYALSQKYFDISLNQQTWQSRAFQFCAGDLYEVIPTLKASIPAYTQLRGKCLANPDPTSLSFTAVDSLFLVNLTYNCTLNTPEITIVKFTVGVATYVRPKLMKKALEFRIERVAAKVGFDTVEGFRIQNQELARFLVQETVAVAVGETVFGTGYPTSTRLYPNLKIQDKYLFLYDSSMRSSSLTT